jgi:tetratricopeptide (TPR) repeat protein
VPFMETRWAFHRAVPPTDDVPHFDMLPPARRLWSRRGLTLAEAASSLESESEGCSLTALERRVLGFHRHGDVPGFEIPARYFHFLRTGDASSIEGVLDHNRHDIVSLAVVMSHALWLVQEGADACREPIEHAALGRIYERAGDVESAVRAFEMAASGDDAAVAAHALWNAGVLLRRQKRYVEAAAAWQRIVDLPPRDRRRLGHLVRRAVEALAIHHEHRVHDLEVARRFADELGACGDARDREDVARRLGRLERKIARRSPAGVQVLGYDE